MFIRLFGLNTSILLIRSLTLSSAFENQSFGLRCLTVFKVSSID